HWMADARFDYVFYGEPEAIVAQALSTPDPASVPGVIDVKHYNPSAPTNPYDIASTADYRKWRKVTDLRALPRAAWHLVELGRYAATGRTSDIGINVPTSRGCFMPCTMCAYNLLEGREMRFRSAEDTVDELAFLNRTYGIRHFRFRDANFSGNRAHLQAVA